MLRILDTFGDKTFDDGAYAVIKIFNKIGSKAFRIDNIPDVITTIGTLAVEFLIPQNKNIEVVWVYGLSAYPEYYPIEILENRVELMEYLISLHKDLDNK